MSLCVDGLCVSLSFHQDDLYKQLEDLMANAVSEKNAQLVQQHEDNENAMKDQRDKLLDMRTRKEQEYNELKLAYDEKCEEMSAALLAMSEEHFDKEKDLLAQMKQQEVEMNQQREDELASLRAEHEEALRKAAEDLELAMTMRDDEFLRFKEHHEDRFKDLTMQMQQMAESHEQQLTRRVRFFFN